jgi:parallel beta-helix repeat protein
MPTQKFFSVTVICVLLFSMVCGLLPTARLSETVAVLYDDSDAVTEETAMHIYAALSRHYSSVDYIPVSSAGQLAMLLERQYLGSIYVFHGTPDGMLIGDDELPWDDLNVLLDDSVTNWHILESCSSQNLSRANVHGIGSLVDGELALIDAMHHASVFLGQSESAEAQRAARGIHNDFNRYVVTNLQNIVRKAFLPERPLDGSTSEAYTNGNKTQYQITSPWGGNTTICGAWGWLVDKVVWGLDKAGWVQVFDKGGQGYIGFQNFSRTKIEAKKPNLGGSIDQSGKLPETFEMPLKFDVDPSIEKGPWYSPEQVKIKITATPKSKIDLAKLTGLSQALQTQGYDIKLYLVPKIHAGILFQEFPWADEQNELIYRYSDGLQFLGGGSSIDLRMEFYIPIATILNYWISGTGTAVANALKLLGIRVDVVAVMSLVTGIDYNALKDASEESIMLLFGIGMLIEGNTDTKGSFVKKAIGVDIPVSWFVLGFKVKGDSGVAGRTVIDSDGARFQIGLPYELLLDFWARVLWFFKFGWSKEWEDTLWYPPTAETYTNSSDLGNSNIDSDKDGVFNKTEELMGLNASNSDTDGDGLFDGNELLEYYTSPAFNDSDADRMADKEELEYWYVGWGHDPLVDYDNDSLPSLLDFDSDNEGLKDGGPLQSTSLENNTCKEEPGERTFNTDPSLPDTDFDSLTDREEVDWDRFNYSCTECAGLPSNTTCYRYKGIDGEDLFVCQGDNKCACKAYASGWYQCWCRYPGDTCQNCISETNYVYWNVTSPTNKDSDRGGGDGLLDGYEKEYYETLRVAQYGFPAVERGGPYEDFDGDGLVNIIDPDSDNDTLLDGEEVLLYRTDPLDIDTDGEYDTNNNGVIDANEILVYTGYGFPMYGNFNDRGEVNGNDWPHYEDWTQDPECVYPWPVRTDPTRADSDGDGYSDAEEWLSTSTPPNPPIFEDSDADGLSNYEECTIYGTDCTAPDTDLDALRDGYERDYFRDERGKNDTEIAVYLNDFDVDDDSMIDGLELVYQTDILDPDTDGDDLLDGLEFAFYFTDPLNNDTDGDGLLDGAEIETGTDPLKVDTDDDGLTDYEESMEHETELLFVGNITYRTDPLNPDTDGDSISDGDEVLGWHWAVNRIVTNGSFVSTAEELWGKHVEPHPETPWWKWKWNRERVYDFPDPYRARFQTNPENPDTDRDGLDDGAEKDMVLSPLTNDTDVDGVSDIEEMELMACMGAALGWFDDEWKRYDIWHYFDFDKDGLSDYDEIQLFGAANWTQRERLILYQDADGDTRSDWEEMRVPITTYNESYFTRGTDNDTIIADEQFLFTISMEDANVTEADLANGTITGELSAAFTDNGYPLSETALLANVTEHTDEWAITDPITDAGTKFMLRRETGNLLNVSGIFYNEIVIKSYTDPLNPDTDEDGLNDGREVEKEGTNPLDSDSDHDGINDFHEAVTYDTNPLDEDTDSDGPFEGWTDGVELELWMARGVTDIADLNDFLTDPDADDDGIVDGLEFMNASLSWLYSDPLNPDVNSNGIEDGKETDHDNDGLSDWVEFYTAPPGYMLPSYASLNAAFTQSESYNASFYNRTIFDPTALRFVNHTCYFINDTDGDGWKDGEEVNVYGTDPLDARDTPVVVPSDDLYINADTVLAPGWYDITDSGAQGVIIINAPNVIVDGNGAILNGSGSGYGIYNPGFDNVGIINCTVLNYDRGIFLHASSDYTRIKNNNLSGNDEYGVEIYSSTGTIITENTIIANGLHGILLFNADAGIIEGNEITGNTYGLYIFDGSDSNEITDNELGGNLNTGVYISDCDPGSWCPGGNSNNYLGQNVIVDNGNYGIYSQASNTTIERNTVCNNGDSDFASGDWLSSSGGENTCDMPNGWDDAGTTGCTYSCEFPPNVFDTGPGTYPSIAGTHNGTITPNQTMVVRRLYTYPCSGTGGHAEYMKIWQGTETLVEAEWAGYGGDWQNITFDEPIVLEANETYYYTITTGSYPQIIHEESKDVAGGTITCAQFTDGNGNVYENWIPAIMLF